MPYLYNAYSQTLDYYTTSSGGGSAPTVVANFSALPLATTASELFYWCSNSQGTNWLPGTLGGTYYSKGLYYSNGVTWENIDIPYQATLTEVNEGTDNEKFVTANTFVNATKWNTKQDTLASVTTLPIVMSISSLKI